MAASQSVNPVCKVCYKDLEATLSQGCHHNTSSKVKVAAAPYGSVFLNSYVREPCTPPGRFSGPYKVCKFRQSSRCGVSCRYAHLEEECVVWNISHKHLDGICCEVCSKCVKEFLEKLQALQVAICTSGHNDFYDSFLWTKEVTDRHVQEANQRHHQVTIVRPLPANISMMRQKGFHYKFRHSHYNCKYRSQGCYHPHGEEEDRQWNAWRTGTEGWTPVKLHDHAVGQYQRKQAQKLKVVKVEAQIISEYKRKGGPVEISKLRELKPSNYKDWFHSLLHLEEECIKSHLKSLPLSLGPLVVRVTDPYYDYHQGYPTCYFTVLMSSEDAEFLANHANSLEVKFQSTSQSIPFRAHPCESVDGGLKLKCTAPIDPKHASTHRLQLLICHPLSWERKHRAVEELPATMVQRLLPEFADFALKQSQRVKNEQYERDVVSREKILELDQIFQQEAADAVLCSPPGPPFLLTGPFGTGKTRLIARLTHQILHTTGDSRVLISVHHHQTADTYPWNFFANLSHPLPCIIYRLLPDKRAPAYPGSFRNVVTCSASQLSDRHKRDNVRLVVTTNGTALRLIHDVKLPPGYFTHIFIDEAAQCTEPEALMPLLLAGPNTKVILAGDHLQVGPEDDVRSQEARDHGFTKSILTRLHERYTRLGTDMSDRKGGTKKKRLTESPLVRQFTANLLTNYRCDASILRLPSNLFYECSLLARANYELHPDTSSSLVFVCTSLNAQFASSPSIALNREVQDMLLVADKLLRHSPEQWSEYGTKHSVCFMARTHQQLSAMRTSIESNYPLLQYKLDNHELQLRSTHSIQGKEYTTVFLCTTEPYDVVEGEVVPKRHAIGASIVNKRVFNTVLTRARTLFVAVGNPFYLMSAETHAPDSGSCWKEYLRRCVESGSTQLPSNCTEDQRQRLLHAVFAEHDPLGRVSRSNEEDTILDTYSWEFLRKLDFVGGNWKMPKMVDEDEEDEEEDDPDTSSRSLPSARSWTLQCTSAYQARAIPLHPGGQEYRIEGQRSRGRALDGARVAVEPIQESLGKVVAVLRQSPTKLFLCRMDTFNSNLFVPLNGKGPKLANLPAVSRKLIQIDKAQDEFEERQKGHVAYKKYPIACYDLSGLEKDPRPVPKLRDVIPLETAKNLVFIVRYIEWREGNVYPMAAVVGTFPIAHTCFHGERLIQAMCQEPSQVAEVEDMKKSMALAQECFQSSKFDPKAVVSRTEGRSFFVQLKGEPCKDLEASQPAFRVGCDKSVTEKLNVSWRFKMCSMKAPEIVLENLSKMIVFEDRTALPSAEQKGLIFITLVVTDKKSKKTEVVKGWTAPDVPQRQVKRSGLVEKFRGKDISLYSFSIACTLTEGQTLPVWVGANTGSLVIQPEVQLVRPAPYLDLCMQHATRPAQCFSSPVLHNASIERYTNIDEYVELWESALLAEAAESSVKDGELLFIDQATLMWTEECFKEVTDLLKQPCFVYKGEVILWLDKDFMSRCGRFIQLNTGDFLCARYEVPEATPLDRAVYHFVVQSVHTLESESDKAGNGVVGERKEAQAQLVKLKMVGERNAVVSNLMRPLVNNKPCTIQIIQCMIPQRRMYESLLKLKVSTDFVQNVLACGHVSLVRPRNLVSKLTVAANPHLFLRDHPLYTCLWSDGGRSASLNPKQIEAMEKALRYKFSLIQGPPGTGKSVTGAHLAYAFYKYNRQHPKSGCVLYCAPSNKATDVVLGYLHELKVKHNSGVKILRIYSRGMEYQTKGSGPRMNEEIFKQIITEKTPKEFQRYSLHEKVNETDFGREIVEMEALFQEMKTRGQIPSLLEEKRYHFLLSAGEREVFSRERFDIILCTCNEAASRRVERHVTPLQCIVDECGYAVEPDAMIPLQRTQHVVLIGDHKQLQPVIKNSVAGENGLNRSLFERYADMYTKAKEKSKIQEAECAFTQLREQYRMVGPICQPPSELFYNKTLTTASSVPIRWRAYSRRAKATFRTPFPDAGRPLLFYNVEGEESSPRSSTTQGGGPESKKNDREARIVVEMVQRFREGFVPVESNSNEDDIVVLTPYLGQKDCINRRLMDLGLKDAVPVKTVNESQGSEANVVILSTVRSMPSGEFDPELLRGDIGWAKEHLGFITDPHQICVAISRSRFGFIIVGNGKLLSCDRTWNQLITHFKRNGCYKH